MSDSPAVLHAVRHGDAEARAAIARAPGTSPELLTFLAVDPAPMVRQAVAAHASTPPPADRMLATDADAAVRQLLAGRVAALAPRLNAPSQGRMARLCAGTLALLVEDTAVEVRTAIANAVRDMPDAPRDLILRLARDSAMPVAEPVIRFSPLLTEADLLALVASPPVPATRRAVARRPELGERVTDAIAGTTDNAAISALLANPSAQMREATLDRLVADASMQPDWQAALVRRAQLPAHTALALGEIVTDHLLTVLAARSDLPQGLAETLRSRVTARLAAPEAEGGYAGEEALFAAAEAGDKDLLLERLAIAAGVSVGRVEAALALRSSRAIAGLCHSAGWSPRLAASVQIALGGICPCEVVQPTAEGGWALSEAELQWQAELLEGLPA